MPLVQKRTTRRHVTISSPFLLSPAAETGVFSKPILLALVSSCPPLCLSERASVRPRFSLSKPFLAACFPSVAFSRQQGVEDDQETMRIMPIGAGNEVGRSCIILKYMGKTIMLDCGIHPVKSNATPEDPKVET